MVDKRTKLSYTYLIQYGANMIKTLLKTSNYNGKYIAFKNFKDNAIVGEGNTPKEAYDKAIKGGARNPVVTFVPIKGMVQIY